VAHDYTYYVTKMNVIVMNPHTSSIMSRNSFSGFPQ